MPKVTAYYCHSGWMLKLIKMNLDNKILITSLREKIRDSLTPLITHDYVLLDLPYYDNIGDTLIWEGTREFLKTLPYKCLYYASKDSFRYRELPPEAIILLSGGGQFGRLISATLRIS